MSGAGEATAAPELAGRLLVAAPSLVDPNFARTVVLVLHHDQGGSLGLVINRPSQMALAEPLPQWVDLAADPPTVFIGGPVAAGAAICLALLADPGGQRLPEGWRAVRGRVVTLDLNGDPSAAARLVRALRVFAGYAGWGPGQLVEELGLGGWILVGSEDADVLAGDPDGLWKAVLRRQRGNLALLAGYPRDPSAN